MTSMAPYTLELSDDPDMRCEIDLLVPGVESDEELKAWVQSRLASAPMGAKHIELGEVPQVRVRYVRPSGELVSSKELEDVTIYAKICEDGEHIELVLDGYVDPPGVLH